MFNSVEVAIVTGGFTLGAVVLTYLGSGLRARQQRKRDQCAVHDQKVAKAAAAVDDLRQRVQLYRGTWALGASFRARSRRDHRKLVNTAGTMYFQAIMSGYCIQNAKHLSYREVRLPY